MSNAHVIDDKSKHPIIQPKVGCNRIIEWYHMDTKHSGRSSTVNSLRQNGYWVLSVNSQVRRLIQSCIRCKFLRGKVGDQLMADLPENRTIPEPTFTTVG